MKSALVEDKKKRGRKGIPRELIYEMRYGKPIYYRDYDKVLSGEKTLEEVVGSGGLQGILVALLIGFLYSKIDMKKYLLATNELGYKFAPRSWYNLDVAIFDREKIDKLPEGYITFPPEVVIEVDTKANLRKFSTPQEYFHRKTQDLLDSGVKKVIWIFTKEKKVWVAEKEKRWFITDWNDTIEVIDGVKLNLSELLKEISGGNEKN
ncbi:hypothetical protein Dester_1356 [Desulfurobacterium thermolithotrophum DSM 11699]|uniref:Restriction endonuclease domain-containing protein n=1 Tax=Desulfurobacterium thermolithotrophum (strain DSM 11699 / BSA) TaxID=868864 RepID=F0S1I4_DESTD|nr:Uma2 family endonuclease [Desulfurobacterium thermolithotrophum]ADY73987.1 hypothetical protein Dester_1356 [Desulfurobacterium thermolithotrophum DSM 11699]